MSPALAGGFLTTATPGKSRIVHFKWVNCMLCELYLNNTVTTKKLIAVLDTCKAIQGYLSYLGNYKKTNENKKIHPFVSQLSILTGLCTFEAGNWVEFF